MFKFFWERALVTAGKTTVRHQEELSNSQVWHLGKLISEEPVALSPLTLCVYVCLSMHVWVCVCVCVCVSMCVCLVYMKVKVAQLCLTLGDPMDYTVQGILQARILEWVAYPFSSGSSWPRNQTGASCIEGGFFTNWAMREAQTSKRMLTNTDKSGNSYLLPNLIENGSSIVCCLLLVSSRWSFSSLSSF